MNKFNDYYNKMQELENVLYANNSVDEVLDAQKEKNKIRSEILDQGVIFHYIYNEFVNSQESGNIYIDLGCNLWADQVGDYVNIMKNNGISYFTISNSSSGLLNTLFEFEKLGCRVLGMTQIKKYNEVVPALKLEIL